MLLYRNDQSTKRSVLYLDHTHNDPLQVQTAPKNPKNPIRVLEEVERRGKATLVDINVYPERVLSSFRIFGLLQ